MVIAPYFLWNLELSWPASCNFNVNGFMLLMYINVDFGHDILMSLGTKLNHSFIIHNIMWKTGKCSWCSFNESQHKTSLHILIHIF